MTTDAPTTPRPAAPKSVDAWTMLAQIGERLRTQPDQPKLRLLAAQACASLRLPELAARWLDSIPKLQHDQPEISPHITHLRHLLSGVDPAEITSSERIQQAQLGVDAIRNTYPIDDDSFQKWASSQPDHLLWALPNRSILRFSPSQPVESECNIPQIEPLDAIAGRVQLPENSDEPSEPLGPIVVLGGISPPFLDRLNTRFQRRPAGELARIIIVEPDPNRVLETLAGSRSSLDPQRFEWYPSEALAIEALRDTRERWTSVSMVSGSAACNSRAFAQQVESITKQVRTETREALASLSRTYDTTDRAFWADRFEQALKGSTEPLRVMVVAARFSTYIKHAAKDIASSVTNAGHTAHLLIEPDDHSRHTSLSIARTLNDFKPDAVIILNYTRSAYKGLLPPAVPCICWIQDAMSHLFNRETARDIDSRTLVVGNISSPLISEHGYPRDRCLTMGVPASEQKFSTQAKISPPIDLLLATNHGETPEQMAMRLETLHTKTGGAPGLVWEVARAVIDGFDQWQAGYSKWWLDDRIKSVLKRQSVSPDAQMVSDLERDVARPLLNRILRHQLVTDAIDLAKRRNLNLVIAGRGWQDDPEYSQYAIGEVTHGSDLRDLYNDSLITLHTSAAWLVHQRLHECVLAGSLPAIMLKVDDDAGIMHPAAVDGWWRQRPTSSRLDDRTLQLSALDSEAAMISLSTLQRVMRGRAHSPNDRVYEPERLTKTGRLRWGLGTSQEWYPADNATSPVEDARYIHALSDSMFWNAEELEQLVDRCRERPDWRAARIEHLRKLVTQSHTYEAIVPDILHRLSAVLNR